MLCTQFHDKLFFQAGDQKAAVSQKLCPPESGAGGSHQCLHVDTGGCKASVCSPHDLTCVLEAGKGKIAPAEGVQKDNKHSQDCMGICVFYSKFISNQPNPNQTFE